MSANLNFYYGAMGCGKTRKLQGDYYSKKEDGFEVIIIKPVIDKKAGDNILSRDGDSMKVDLLIEPDDNIYNIIAMYLLEHNLDFILVDEAQFLTKNQIDLLSEIVDILGINVYCYGLRTDFKSNLFEGSKRLFEISDNIIGLSRQCSCGENKIYNMRIENEIPIFDGEIIAIDEIDATYKSVCRKCYKSEKKKLLKRTKK